MTPDQMRKYQMEKRLREDGGPGSGPHKGMGSQASDFANKMTNSAFEKTTMSGNSTDAVAHDLASKAHALAADVHRHEGNTERANFHDMRSKDHSMTASNVRRNQGSY